jgi:hypothetical protein
MGSLVRSKNCAKIVRLYYNDIKNIYKKEKNWDIDILDKNEYVYIVIKTAAENFVSIPIIEGDDCIRGMWIDINITEERMKELIPNLYKYLIKE